MVSPAPGWSAQLRSGPFDGADVGLGIAPEDLPPAVLVTFIVPGEDGGPVAHSYALDHDRTSFTYLGADTDPGAPRSAALDLPLDSLEVLGAGDAQLARRFYDLLLERHPGVRPLFAADLEPQVARLTAALRAVISHAADTAWVESATGDLGRLHDRLGVTAPMYDLFSECMLDALAEQYGARWTSPVRESWTEALAVLRAMMLAGVEDD